MAFDFDAGKKKFVVFGRTFKLPEGRRSRIALGGALVLAGSVGFLPVVGFWMIPVGLLVLSQDLPMVRRWRRSVEVKWGRRQEAKRKAKAKSE